MKIIPGYEHGMGIGGWLTNYKRFSVLPEKWRMVLTVGDFEHFDSYITERDVAYIASLGMDHIRLGFDQIVLEESPMVYRERIFKLIDNFIDWCEKYHVNALLNLHKSLGNYCDVAEESNLFESEELQARLVALWVAFAKRYKGRPHICFELLNEVRDVDPEAWNDLADRCIKGIREIDADRLIMVGATGYNNPDHLPGLRVWDDENVIYTFHQYAPFEFTHQRGVLQQSNLYYNREMPYPGDIERYRDCRKVAFDEENAYENYTVMDAQFLRDVMQPAFDWAEAHPDKMLHCGEFGTIRHCNIKYRENWMRDMIRLLKEHGIPYCVWNYLSTPNDGNRFSLVDDDKREILSDELARIIRGEV